MKNFKKFKNFLLFCTEKKITLFLNNKKKTSTVLSKRLKFSYFFFPTTTSTSQFDLQMNSERQILLTPVRVYLSSIHFQHKIK